MIFFFLSGDVVAVVAVPRHLVTGPHVRGTGVLARLLAVQVPNVLSRQETRELVDLVTCLVQEVATSELVQVSFFLTRNK